MEMKWTIAAVVFLARCLSAQTASAHEHWVSTWATSPQQPRAFPAPRPATAAAAAARPPAGTAPRLTPPIASFHNQTVRMIAHTSIGGRRVRIELSNAFGSEPLAIGAAHIALRDKESAIIAASDRTLQFSGRPTAWIPPGAMVISDPVNLDVPAASDLAVSIYIPESATTDTMHAVGLHTTYISKEGDTTAAPAIVDGATAQSFYYLTNVDVAAPLDAAAVWAFWDFITD